MGWVIKCTDKACGKETRSRNIVDLIEKYRDHNGWFLCQCGKQGYIEKSYKLQEGNTWKPYFKGIITLGKPDGIFQPFAFLVSDDSAPSPIIKEIWVSYYKNSKPSGGNLKLGHGPGGPPFLNKERILHLLKQLKDIGFLAEEEITGI